jgi:parallel beta-helix repeat protein
MEGFVGDIHDNTIIDNTFIGSGITIMGESASTWNTHRIQRNTIDGKPIYYYKNALGVIVPRDAGQIILASCALIRISGVNVSDHQRAIQIAHSRGITVDKNTIWNRYSPPLITTSEGIYVYQSQDIQLSENRVFGYYYGIYFDTSTTCALKGNTLIKNGIGVYGYSSTQNTIDTNLFVMNSEDAITLLSDTGDTIAGNQLLSNPFGINLLYQTTSTMIRGNSITESEYGIYLAVDCDQNTISNNNIKNNTYGINLTAFSEHNTVSGNMIGDNDIGLIIFGSMFNEVYQNDFVRNHIAGVRLLINDVGWEQFWSNGNHLYHNNFLFNTEQAYDQCYNTWDNGYPRGGNYWSDYFGIDHFSGPQQNQPGSDGIGDTPYNITGIDPPNQDQYPYMTAGGWY